MFPIIMIPTFEGETITYVDGSEQRILGVDEAQLRIRLRYRYLNETDRNSIFAFFIARKGRTETFYWVNPQNSLPYIVRFEEDMMNVEYFAHKLWHLNEVNFIETYWRAS